MPRFIVKFVNGTIAVFDRLGGPRGFRNVSTHGLWKHAQVEADRRNGGASIRPDWEARRRT